MKKVTFGIVNCNRLFYLKSCFESLLETTEDYSNKELIVIDNASIEKGTSEYLDLLEQRGVSVIRKSERNPSNEYAIGLNEIIKKSTGDYVCLLQGDMQFVMRDWLHEVIEFYEKNLDVVGSFMLDAQRRSTISGHDIRQFSNERMPAKAKLNFFADLTRDPISPAGDALYNRKVIEQIGLWSENNVNHEGSLDSENDMRYRVLKLMKEKTIPQYFTAFSSIPQSIAIYTDKRGTQGRVRGERRYGDYWEAKDDLKWKYYELIKLNELNTSRPNSIEDIAQPIGFEKMLDENGNWLKNPIRPESALESDWVTLGA